MSCVNSFCPKASFTLFTFSTMPVSRPSGFHAILGLVILYFPSPPKEGTINCNNNNSNNNHDNNEKGDNVSMVIQRHLNHRARQGRRHLICRLLQEPDTANTTRYRQADTTSDFVSQKRENREKRKATALETTRSNSYHYWADIKLLFVFLVVVSCLLVLNSIFCFSYHVIRVYV